MTTTPETRWAPSWNDIKAKLVNCDRAGLIGLFKDLHALNPEKRGLPAHYEQKAFAKARKRGQLRVVSPQVNCPATPRHAILLP